MIRGRVDRSGALIVLAAMLLVSGMAESQPFNPASGKEISIQEWVNENFARGKVPPFSFRYGGIESGTFITSWKYSAENSVSDDPSVRKSVFSYTDPETGLTAKCLVTAYSDFPAVEWVVRFINGKAADSPPIEMADVIDYSFKFKGDGQAILHHSLGSDARRSDFQPIDGQMKVGQKIILMPDREQ